MSEGYKKSRKKGYAAVLKSAPAYTWGKAHERLKGKYATMTLSSWQMSTDIPFVIADDPGPGPGEYNPPGDKYDKGIGFGSSSRYKSGSDGTPG